MIWYFVIKYPLNLKPWTLDSSRRGLHETLQKRGLGCGWRSGCGERAIERWSLLCGHGVRRLVWAPCNWQRGYSNWRPQACSSSRARACRLSSRPTSSIRSTQTLAIVKSAPSTCKHFISLTPCPTNSLSCQFPNLTSQPNLRLSRLWVIIKSGISFSSSAMRDWLPIRRNLKFFLFFLHEYLFVNYLVIDLFPLHPATMVHPIIVGVSSWTGYFQPATSHLGT